MATSTKKKTAAKKTATKKAASKASTTSKATAGADSADATKDSAKKVVAKKATSKASSAKTSTAAKSTAKKTAAKTTAASADKATTDKATTVDHMKDDATNFPDPNDRATQEEEFSLELRTRDRERKLIKKINEAQRRIDDEEYGYCESCGVEIGVARLEARLTAELCIDCKTLEEIRERQIA